MDAAFSPSCQSWLLRLKDLKFIIQLSLLKDPGKIIRIFIFELSLYDQGGLMKGFKLLYWHWFVFGMVLMLLELIVPSYTIFWFGLGGLVVGLILFAFTNLEFAWQISIWLVSSIGLILFWFHK
jgi:membrane-bound ClpP family serine protease